MPPHHPQTLTPTPLTRREALTAERAAASTHPRRTSTTSRTGVNPVAVRPLPAPSAPAAPSRGRTLRSRALAAIPVTGATAAMALFAAAALPAQATTWPIATVPGISPVTTGQSFTAAGVTISADRDGYTVTKPAPKPTITTTKPASTATAADSEAATATGAIVNTGAGDIRWPVAGAIRISSPFGARSAPCATCSSMHQGADITPGAGTPIGAVAAGTVRVSGTHPEYGQYVIIDHQIDGQTISTLYAHMIFGSSPLRAGQQVAVGQLVGLVGNTGASTGAHLHLQVMLGGVTPVDPIAWLTANAGRSV